MGSFVAVFIHIDMYNMGFYIAPPLPLARHAAGVHSRRALFAAVAT